jgi:threonine/homoserine/homoserine lactone efflux protein
MIKYLILGISYGFIAAVQPGPFQTFIIAQTIKNGWKKTLPASLAPLISDGPILILVFFLLTTLPEIFIIILRIIGGFFLIYLSYRTFKTWRNFNQISNESGNDKSLFNAVIVNLLNPNPYLAWSLVMGPILLEGWKINHFLGIFFIIGFYSTIVTFIAATIFVFTFARDLGQKFNKYLIGLSTIILFGFGIFQLIVGFGSIN